jgi:hypothetical protein
MSQAGAVLARPTVRVGNLRVVQDVEEFGSELGGVPFPELPINHDGEVPVAESRVAEHVATRSAQRAWIKDHRIEDHRELLVSFLEACIKAQRWLLDPANNQQVIQVLTSEYHLAPGIAAEYHRTSFSGHGGYAKDAQFDLRGFENVLKLRAEVEGQWGGHPLRPTDITTPLITPLPSRK